MSHLSHPQLSRISQNAEKIGQESVRILVERLENKTQEKPRTTTVDFAIKLKGTTLPV
jgi:LacI family transcriptional regulator